MFFPLQLVFLEVQFHKKQAYLFQIQRCHSPRLIANEISDQQAGGEVAQASVPLEFVHEKLLFAFIQQCRQSNHHLQSADWLCFWRSLRSTDPDLITASNADDVFIPGMPWEIDLTEPIAHQIKRQPMSPNSEVLRTHCLRTLGRMIDLDNPWTWPLTPAQGAFCVAILYHLRNYSIHSSGAQCISLLQMAYKSFFLFLLCIQTRHPIGNPVRIPSLIIHDPTISQGVLRCMLAVEHQISRT